MYRIRVPFLLCLLVSLALTARCQATSYDTETISNLTYTSGGATLPIELFLPMGAPGPRTLVLLIPEASEPASDGRAALRPWGEWLATHGYVAALPAYRLPPDYRYPAQLDDLRAAHQWLISNADAYQCDARRVVLLGASLGGLLAAQYALTAAPHPSPVIAVVTIASPMDLRVAPPTLAGKIALQLLLGATREDAPTRYAQASPLTHITCNAPPFFLVHRTSDANVPYRQAQEMSRALTAAGVAVTLETLPGNAHMIPDLSSPDGKQIATALGIFLAQRCAP
ncbi:MAG TPA: alpha/beta hydrolase [Armatimonadota bacterium]|jgi:acetyl esterase/lipase